MRDSTIIYRSFYEAIKELPKTNQAEVWNAIFEFSLNFNEVELSGLSKTIFTLIKPQLQANIAKFINGTKPKQQRSKTEANDKLDESKIEGNVNVNENTNENVNLNENENKFNNRKLKFSDTLKPFLEIYGKDLLNDFFKYWTEPNKSGTKFRQELEKTWDVTRRLENWAKNDKNFNNGKQQITAGTKKQPVKSNLAGYFNDNEQAETCNTEGELYEDTEFEELK